MKKLIEVPEDGIESLLGKRITLFCMNYIYTGRLTGINDRFVLLDEPAIVYETGAFDSASWKDAQKLPRSIFVMLNSVEALGEVK